MNETIAPTEHTACPECGNTLVPECGVSDVLRCTQGCHAVFTRTELKQPREPSNNAEDCPACLADQHARRALAFEVAVDGKAQVYCKVCGVAGPVANDLHTAELMWNQVPRSIKNKQE